MLLKSRPRAQRARRPPTNDRAATRQLPQQHPPMKSCRGRGPPRPSRDLVRGGGPCHPPPRSRGLVRSYPKSPTAIPGGRTPLPSPPVASFAATIPPRQSARARPRRRRAPRPSRDLVHGDDPRSSTPIPSGGFVRSEAPAGRRERSTSTGQRTMSHEAKLGRLKLTKSESQHCQLNYQILIHLFQNVENIQVLVLLTLQTGFDSYPPGV